MRNKKIIGIILFNCIGKHLPSPQFPIKFIARFSKAFRGICGKLILESCGDNVNICGKSSFSTKVSLGNNSGIGYKAVIPGRCIIGDNVIMAPECNIWTVNHRTDRTDIPIKYQGNEEEKPVIIGNDVWIGSRVTILPGVTIGHGVVIGAGSIVTKNVPDYVVIAGNPAKIVKYRRCTNDAKEGSVDYD